MTMMIDETTLGPNGRPLLRLKISTPATAQANPARVTKKDLAAAEAWLKETYPLAFTSPRIPLAMGIKKEVLADAAATPHHDAAICIAIRKWVNGKSYLKALTKPDAWRHDLRGKPVIPVSEKHREYSTQLLETK